MEKGQQLMKMRDTLTHNINDYLLINVTFSDSAVERIGLELDRISCPTISVFDIICTQISGFSGVHTRTRNNILTSSQFPELIILYNADNRYCQDPSSSSSWRLPPDSLGSRSPAIEGSFPDRSSVRSSL